MTQPAEELSIIGKPLIKPDAFAKVSGQTKFADDLAMPRMIYGESFAVRIRVPGSCTWMPRALGRTPACWPCSPGMTSPSSLASSR